MTNSLVRNCDRSTNKKNSVPKFNKLPAYQLIIRTANNRMTRIELGKEASVSSEKTNHTKFTPSNTEKEAKRRFMSTLENGVGKLLAQGNGRDRISTELLNEISNGCSPDETEVC